MCMYLKLVIIDFRILADSQLCWCSVHVLYIYKCVYMYTCTCNVHVLYCLFIVKYLESELITSGLLSPRSTEGTPNKQHPEDLSFNHSPISPISLQPFPSTPLNAILSSRLYPPLHEDEDEDETDENDYCTPMTTPGLQRPLNRAKSDINLTRVSIVHVIPRIIFNTCTM